MPDQPPTAVRSPRLSTDAWPPAECTDHDGGQGRQHDGDDDPGQPGRLLHALVVDRRERDDRAHGERALPRRPRVGAEGECHRRTARGLADHEPPAGEVTPEVTEPLTAVDVGAARLRVHGRELGRRRGVAVRHDRGDAEPDQQPAARGRGGRAERGEHPRPEHRAEPDDHRVEQPQPARQPTWRRITLGGDRWVARGGDPSI